MVIGRGDDCEIQLNDPSVSRVHCRMMTMDGCVSLTDLDSRWGTFVNGQVVESCDLKPGDRIRIGETVLKLEIVGEPNQTTLAPSSQQQRPQDAETMAPGLTPETGRESFIVEDDLAFAVADEGSSAPFEASLFLGQTFLQYRIQRTLAQSSTGIIFCAKEQQSNRPVALKIFEPSVFADGIAGQRFERAAKIMLQQRHANIVELYNAGRKNSYCFTASQMIEGESTAQMINRIGVAGMLDPIPTLQIAVDLCEALRFAEAMKIVHRNIQPSNVLIRQADRVALLNDLVLAKATTQSGAEQLTQAGEILGDVSYMSPEQLGSGQPVDCRSDIYQLGVTLYALLTGRTPFEGGRISETVTAVLSAEPKPVRDTHMATPAQFETVVLKMLSKNPRDRYQNANELSAALTKVCREIGQQNIKPREAPPEQNWSGALDGLL